MKPSLSAVAVPGLVCLVLGALGGVGTALVTQDAPARPPSFTPPRTAPPTYALLDENGVVRTPTGARGRVLVVTFIFTRCRSACPRIAAEIRDAILAAGDGVELHAISVDPEHDTPVQARAWLKRMGLADTAAHVLLGDRAALTRVWDRYGIAPIAAKPRGGTPLDGSQGAPEPPDAALDPYPAVDDGAYRGLPRHGGYWDFEHSAYALLVDKQGNQRVGFPFEHATTDRILADLRLLQAE